jgi:hypothetical protein
MDYIPNRNGVLLEPHMVVAKLKVNNAGEEEREMGTAEQQIQGEFLNMLTKKRVRVSVFLVNGIRLVGFHPVIRPVCADAELSNGYANDI